MTSLRERLEAKQKATAVLPVPVGNAGAAAQQVATLRAALDVRLAAVRADAAAGVVDPAQDQTAERLRTQLGEAQARLADTVAHVELVALDPDVWDQVLEGLQPDADGELDLGDVRAALLAASAVDEELRDEQWWQEQLTSGRWSKGDLLACNNTLLSLNLNVVGAAAAGKG